MTAWMLKTSNQPLTATRELLKRIWAQANLHGMLAPVYHEDRRGAEFSFIEDPARLSAADPFLPLMQNNAGEVVARVARERPDAHFAAVLHPCEMRALDAHIKKDGLHLENWLLIGTECLACFSREDFDWRIEAVKDIEELTNLVLRNARQGGIAADRFRAACQICARPEPLHADLCLGILGLPVRETMLVFARNEALAHELALSRITDGVAPDALIAQHDHMLAVVEERHQRARERMLRDLPNNLPATLDELVTFLINCQPCQKCLESCPVQTNELIPALQSGVVPAGLARQWLTACAECGMCEQACPKGIPLAAITNRIGHTLKHESLAI